MHDFLDTFRNGPDPLPPGKYAMWLPSPAEPKFAQSKTRQNIGRVYTAVAGIETYIVADILRRLGAVSEDSRRVRLPEDLMSFPVLGPEDGVFVLSLSQEKGIRFHFHDSASPVYRNAVLAGLVGYAEFRRRTLKLGESSLDEAAEWPPAAWWSGNERVAAHMEGEGEPVQAVGQILVG